MKGRQLALFCALNGGTLGLSVGMLASHTLSPGWEIALAFAATLAVVLIAVEARRAGRE